MSLILAQERQQTSLFRGSGVQMKASVPFRRESMTKTCHCFSMVLVLMLHLLQGVGGSDLSERTCRVPLLPSFTHAYSVIQSERTDRNSSYVFM